MPINLKNYPKGWRKVSWEIRVIRAQGQCEYIHPATGQRCQAIDWQPHPITGKRVVLSTCHLNHILEDIRPENLAALCQLHHNRHDREQHAAALDRYRKEQRAAKREEQREAGQQEFDL